MSGEREHPTGREPSGAERADPLTAYRLPLTGREGQTLGGDSLLIRYVNLVKLPHTLFALPFALLGVLAAAQLNSLCLWLSPLALGWILLYSLSKRFTWWPHLWLGVSLAIAPVGGYLAVTGRWSQPAWVLLAITLAVATWVAGFDIFYALPDAGFDRAEGLRSAVVRLGESRAIRLAKLLHGVTIPALALFGYGAGFGPWYYMGLITAAAILAYEHQLVRPGDLSRLDAAFFTMNGVMSLTVFGFALLDWAVRR